MTNYDPDAVYSKAMRQLHINRLRDVPVLFANGIDDDLPALHAVFTNKPFAYGGKLYKEGERFDLPVSAIIAVSCGSLLIKFPNADIPLRPPVHQGKEVVITVPEGNRGGRFVPQFWRFGAEPLM